MHIKKLLLKKYSDILSSYCKSIIRIGSTGDSIVDSTLFAYIMFRNLERQESAEV